jgi:hypothetical protein
MGTFITIPLCHDHRIAGRLYRTMWRMHGFDAFDVDFPLQVIEHAMPAIHNICRVDRFALDAAEAERQRIAITFTTT